MIHRNQGQPRIPHYLAAIAALALLVTAWTNRDSETPEGASRAPERLALTAADSDGGDSNASKRRPSPRFSLMLFRFN